MPGLDDYGALLRSGAASVQDYAGEEAKKQLLALQRDQLKAQVDKAAQQLQAKNDFQHDVATVLSNPTAEAYSALIAKHPEFAQQAKSSWDVLDGARQTADLQSMSEVYAAAAHGKPDLAAALLERRIEADKAAGHPVDPMDQNILDALKSGDPAQQKGAMGMIGLTLSAVTGPEKFSATYGSLTKGQEDFTLGPGGRRYDAEGNLIAEAPFAPRPVTVGEGQTIVEYQPGGGGPASGGGAGNGTPRGVRNNNPGNIKDGPFARAQPGYKGADSEGFAIFDSLAVGMAAQTALLGNRYLARGIDTPDAIVETYAPASANSPEARANYKQHIASALGIGIGDKITPDKLPQLAQAMAGFENGSGGPRVIAKGPPKTAKEATPSETRVVAGKIYVKINGQWYQKGA